MSETLGARRMGRRSRAVREREERERLSPAATLAVDSAGRERPEPEDDFRTAFERDRDRILHAKAFRRLKHKTQVFIDPEGDHYVTRLTHTLQVAQIGRAIAAALGLNEPLAEAICLGHDIGHSPFGHAGEDALTPYVDGEWQHSLQSVRVVSKLEPLNLTRETLDGIRAHPWRIDPPPATPEGACCRYADRIAYLAHDADDAMRAGLIRRDDFPAVCLKVFGEPGRDWIDTMIHAIIAESEATGALTMEPDALDAMHTLRRFMFDRVYLREEARRQSERAVGVIRRLVDHFAAHADEVPEGYAVADGDAVQRAVDYVAGMSDSYAIRTHDRLFRPRGLY